VTVRRILRVLEGGQTFCTPLYKGYKNFILHFDLPSFRIVSLDSKNPPSEDDVDVSVLGFDHSSLGTKGSGSKLYLTRTQASVMMVGVANYSYSTFGFMSGVEEFVELEDVELEELDQERQGFERDLIGGDDIDDSPTKTLAEARAYFLRCLCNRSGRAKNHYGVLVYYFQITFKAQVSNRLFLCFQSALLHPWRIPDLHSGCQVKYEMILLLTFGD